MSSKSKKLLVGNWKMNPTRLEDARHIISAYKKVSASLEHTSIVACPPFVYLSLAVSLKKNKKSKSKSSAHSAKIIAGAQDVFFESEGAFTGEVSAKMLRDIGVSYVIVGHSERRRLGETDEVVSKKAMAAISAGLCPIICCGEAVHDADGAYLAVIKEQLKKSLPLISKASISKIVIAYEPIWAIGAKEAMKPEQIRETALFIKKVVADIFGRDAGLDLPVLYGGSVNWRNAGDIIRIGGVQGLLVGRESVNVPGFVELAKAVDTA
jgi:triosephosphate isomerase